MRALMVGLVVLCGCSPAGVVDGGTDDGGGTTFDAGNTDAGCTSTNQVPVPIITACEPSQLTTDPDCLQGAMTPASYSLAAISPAVVTLSGAASTDDGQVSEYRFTLLPPFPGGATSVALANNAVRTAQKTTTLTIPSGVSGTFRISLTVVDDCGASSIATHVMTLNVSP